MRIVIVGAGIVGLSTAWALVCNGHNVEVIDQSTIPNPNSASFDQHRMIRPQYGGQSGYTQMIPEAFEAWEQLWLDLGETYYSETGVLSVDLGNTDWMLATKHALQSTGTPFEVLSKKEAEKLAPQLELPSSAWGLFAPKAGVLFADKIVFALSRWLIAHGVKFHEHCKATEVDFERAVVRCKDGKELGADRLVIAAGAWLPQLLPQYQSHIESVRSTVAYISPPECFRKDWASSPSLFLISPSSFLYCLPPIGGTDLKFGGAPNLRSERAKSILEVPELEQKSILSAFKPYLRKADAYVPQFGAGGYYADPVDKKFTIEQLHRVTTITGCGGRMFKFGAAVGRRVAAALEGDRGCESVSTWAKGEASMNYRYPK